MTEQNSKFEFRICSVLILGTASPTCFLPSTRGRMEEGDPP